MRPIRRWWTVPLLLALAAAPLAAQDVPPAPAAGEAAPEPPRPASEVTVGDRPNDVGNGVRVKWTLSPDDIPDAAPRRVIRYDVLRRVGNEEDFKPAGSTTYRVNEFEDRSAVRGEEHFYQVVAVGPGDAKSEPAASETAIVPQLEWFDESRAWFGILLLLVGGAVVYFIEAARRGRQLRVRKIAGLDAVTEAVGRATEMGRSCLFVPGIQDINDIQTVAGITILSRVAQIAAEYDARIEVPTARSLVMTTARETVAASYAAAGRPDAYREDDIYYLTDEQFGYVAGVTGTMVRQKPAACFYMGSFYAESLILAETGNGIGAIQVAGTAQPSQLPFFVAACDYTLIGEEFFAASAYLSGEPKQLGSLKGQDFGKLLGAVLLVAGCLLATTYAVTENERLKPALDFLRNNILGNQGFLE